MRITEEDIKKWFPKDNRFLHFCAKYYGYSFHSDEVVEHASYMSFLNIKRYMDRGDEFENEKQKIGMAMSAFKFGILNGYSTYQNANRKNLDSKTEAQLTYGYDGDEYSLYQAKCISHDKPYDNSSEVLREYIEANLPPLERRVIIAHFFEDIRYSDLAKELCVSPRKIELAKVRGLNKIKNYYKQEREHEQKTREADKPRYISAVSSKLRIDELNRPNVEKQRAEDSYSKAMSFIYSSQKI